MNETFEILKKSVEKAKEELDRAIYLEEYGGNAGIRKLNSNKVDWLKWVVYLAELGLEYEKLLNEPVHAVEAEPKTITDYQKAINLFKGTKINF
jgi:hypothetical protein